MTDKTKPSAKEVTDFHTNADIDGSPKAAHHTLGPGVGQSSPGNHDHRGGTSKLILEGTQLTGVKAGNTALASVIAALVELGAQDATT